MNSIGKSKVARAGLPTSQSTEIRTFWSTFVSARINKTGNLSLHRNVPTPQIMLEVHSYKLRKPSNTYFPVLSFHYLSKYIIMRERLSHESGNQYQKMEKFSLSKSENLNQLQIIRKWQRQKRYCHLAFFQQTFFHWWCNLMD